MTMENKLMNLFVC